MKKLFLIFGLIFLVSAGAFAESVSDGAVSEEVEDYVKGFVEKGGIDKDKIEKIKKIDQANLPDGVEIQEIAENKVGIYEVNYTEQNDSKKIFVVTYSTTEFEQVDEVKNIQNFNFGYVGMSTEADYLQSAVGVRTGKDSGYVMMRSGSVTGISTSLDISGSGKVYVRVYKNGEDTRFGNMVSSSDDRKVDYDLQSEEVVTFRAGDVLSVYVELEGDVNWGEVTTLIETTN